MLFCFLLAQEQKRREMILARELKKPVEDMVLKDSKVIEIDDYTGRLELCRRRDLLNNLTVKKCDKVEKFKKFKTILVKSLKMRRRFDVHLTSLSSQK